MKELKQCIENNKLLYDNTLEELVTADSESEQAILKDNLDRIKYQIKVLEYAKIILEKEPR